ncbi:MAG: hydrogenase formation protein HypD [Thiotrichaceae bacterium]|nr:hydrogenase formation protein HypD [Thiotrichaceae bacterium]
MSLTAKQWLQQIHSLPLSSKVKIMNVCGGHERSITMAGLRTALPENIELIPGPGCPVCICPEEDIYAAIQLALNEKVILAAFGDMLRVPVNVAKKQIRSLEQAKAAGANIQAIASPLDILQLAQQYPDETIVFFVTGFETTTAPVAALLAQGIPDNVLILLSGRLTYPAVELLLATGEANFDALIAPGHVATIMGADEWQFCVDKYHLPTAVAGFEPESLLASIYSVLRQYLEQKPFLDNCYPQVVTTQGNPTAQQHLNQTMHITAANWRGIGEIAHSGFELNQKNIDAKTHFPDYIQQARQRAGEMPAGCDCAKVVLGKIYPNQCQLYDTACTPRHPIGPCMVSDEGACRIWWSHGMRE